jgi:hypothetical protein
MSEAGKSQVRIGWTDGSRLVGVEPPLTDGDISDLEYAGVIVTGSATQIEEPGPACTVINVSSEPGSSPEVRTRDAHELAGKITLALNQWKEKESDAGYAVYIPELVPLVGQNSSPFNPDTQGGN